MAKGKRKRGKQGIVSKGANTLLLLLTFIRPISLLIRSPSMGSIHTILNEATFGLVSGKLDLAAGARMYAPAGAAVGLGFLKSYALRHFPVR